MEINLQANEMVKKAGNTSVMCPVRGNSKGKLILTTQRLCYKDYTNKSRNFDIVPEEIKEVIFFNTGFLSFKGLNVVLKNGSENKFKLKERDTWGKMINQMY